MANMEITGRAIPVSSLSDSENSLLIDRALNMAIERMTAEQDHAGPVTVKAEELNCREDDPQFSQSTIPYDDRAVTNPIQAFNSMDDREPYSRDPYWPSSSINSSEGQLAQGYVQFPPNLANAFTSAMPHPNFPLFPHQQPFPEVSSAVAQTYPIMANDYPGFVSQDVVNGTSYNEKKPARWTAFITYVSKNDEGGNVFDIVCKLQKAGISARVDFLAEEDKKRTQNRNQWLDDCIEDSDVIIICIDPKYYSTMKSIGNGSEASDGFPDSSDEAYYVYTQIQTKYIVDTCRNYNLIPVLIGNARYSQTPRWLQNTKVYQWPKDEAVIVARITSL